MNIEKLKQSDYSGGKLKQLFETAQLLRGDVNKPADVSIFDLALVAEKGDEANFKDEADFTSYVNSFLHKIGVETTDTISNLLTVPDDNIKWLVPEIVRSYIRLGMDRSPIYPNIIRSEETINTLLVKMPYVNQSDAAPRYVNEGETIQLGDVSYGSRELRIRKMGRGLKMTDEMRKYTSINLVNIFFEDFGVRLGYALDGIAVDVLQNGDQLNGSTSAVVIGVDTVGAITHRDLLRVWLRLTRMGKTPNVMVGGEEIALDILDLPEFKKSPNTAAPEARLDIKTPVPTSSSFYIHADVAPSQVVILDPRTALVKFNSQPLMVEHERIVSNQTEASYASTQTGFAVLFADSRVVLDSQEDFQTNGWPSYMNPDALATETVKYK